MILTIFIIIIALHDWRVLLLCSCELVVSLMMFCQLRYSGTAHMILQNMNQSVDPCDDFYQVFSSIAR